MAANAKLRTIWKVQELLPEIRDQTAVCSDILIFLCTHAKQQNYRKVSKNLK